MCVCDEDMRDGLAAHGIEQRRDVSRIVRSRIDDRDLAAPDDVADRALEGEWSRVVGNDAANAWSDFFGAAGLELKNLVVRNVVSHAGPVFLLGAYPPDRNRLVKPRLDAVAHICKHRGE